MELGDNPQSSMDSSHCQMLLSTPQGTWCIPVYCTHQFEWPWQNIGTQCALQLLQDGRRLPNVEKAHVENWRWGNLPKMGNECIRCHACLTTFANCWPPAVSTCTRTEDLCHIKHTCTVYLAFQIIMFLPLKWDHCTLVMYPLRDGTDRSLHGMLTAIENSSQL